MLSIIHKRYYMEEHGKYRLLPKLCFPPQMTLGRVIVKCGVWEHDYAAFL
jgi:hypothetical protein